jgi:hypothetical protein
MTGLAKQWLVAGPILAAAALGACQEVAAAERTKPWRVVKCERYRQAWAEVRKRWGLEGLGEAFIARHDGFLASGCTADADVCPRSPREIEIANILTIAAMNAGAASTFPPFACRR